MSGLLGELQKKNPSIDRGKKITTNIQVSKNDIINDKTEIDTDTIPANIRVDQGIRNKINALTILGYGESQKDVVQYLLNLAIETMSPDTAKKIDDLAEIYRKKDIQNYNKRK